MASSQIQLQKRNFRVRQGELESMSENLWQSTLSRLRNHHEVSSLFMSGTRAHQCVALLLAQALTHLLLGVLIYQNANTFIDPGCGPGLVLSCVMWKNVILVFLGESFFIALLTGANYLIFEGKYAGPISYKSPSECLIK